MEGLGHGVRLRFRLRIVVGVWLLGVEGVANHGLRGTVPWELMISLQTIGTGVEQELADVGKHGGVPR